jgi:hypothetical protein
MIFNGLNIKSQAELPSSTTLHIEYAADSSPFKVGDTFTFYRPFTSTDFFLNPKLEIPAGTYKVTLVQHDEDHPYSEVINLVDVDSGEYFRIAHSDRHDAAFVLELTQLNI